MRVRITIDLIESEEEPAEITVHADCEDDRGFGMQNPPVTMLIGACELAKKYLLDKWD